MKVVHSTGKTAKKKIAIEEKKKSILKKKIKSRLQRYKLHAIAFILCAILYAFSFAWYIYLIPMVIHLAIIFWVFAVEFYVARNKERAWNAYLHKYGIIGKDGKMFIPPHVKMTHKKLIEQGKKIAI